MLLEIENVNLFAGELLVEHGEGNISDSWENLSLASKILKSPQPSRQLGDGDMTVAGEQQQQGDDFSAEAVAKCLLKKFHGCSIPAASEVKQN